MATKLLVVPKEGVVLLGIEEALLAELIASGKIERLRLEDQPHGDQDAAGTNVEDEGRKEGPPSPAGEGARGGTGGGGSGVGSSGRSENPTASDFRSAVARKFAEAEADGLSSVVLKSGDLHREVGGYPSTHHRMPVLCGVMRELMQPGDRVLTQPPSGAGATLIIEYKLPR